MSFQAFRRPDWMNPAFQPLVDAANAECRRLSLSGNAAEIVVRQAHAAQLHENAINMRPPCTITEFCLGNMRHHARELNGFFNLSQRMYWRSIRREVDKRNRRKLAA